MYKEKRLHRSEFVPIRGLRYHVRIWDSANASASDPAASAGPPLVLVHGWMDVGASYQFMVDAFSNAFTEGRIIIAPDWRGFGLTSGSAGSHHAAPDNTRQATILPDDTLGNAQGESRPEAASLGTVDSYWFGDYLADLDFLLDHYAPGQAVDLVGHSMGGNVAMTYAGVRPERIRRLVNLEGFGQPATEPAEAPDRYAKWMDELKSLQRGDMDLKGYADVCGVAKRLMKTNPRLSEDKANWLAMHWSRPDATGKWQVLGDAAHKVVSANIYRADETLELYKRISMPLLAVEASDDSLGKWWKGQFTLAQYHERLKLVKQSTVAVIQDAGHMLHHDRPEQLALMIADFLA